MLLKNIQISLFLVLSAVILGIHLENILYLPKVAHILITIKRIKQCGLLSCVIKTTIICVNSIEIIVTMVDSLINKRITGVVTLCLGRNELIALKKIKWHRRLKYKIPERTEPFGFIKDDVKVSKATIIDGTTIIIDKPYPLL